ncbi:MAG: ABC transporter ATP-binding protein [Syntrophomonadaceae bacterium]|nr:ABC transporter ATP-binding protein [Syntrophomonadaceae bacterium]
MENALVLRDVTKSYGDFELGPIDLTLPSGCIMGFIGENGAGKTTVMKLILELIRRDRGHITLLGQENLSPSRDLREHVGVVLDECCFPEMLNARQLNRVLRGIYATWNEAEFLALCARFGLPLKKSIKYFSRGMKMKLSLAAALSHNSLLLLLDEATSGLDPIARDEVLEALRDFIQNESHSVFMSSHILSDLEKICDYITYIRSGKLVFTEQKDVLLEDYGILKCSEEQLGAIDPALIKGVRTNLFGVQALVCKKKMPPGHVIDPAGIEDIMLFYHKEER